MANCSGCGAGKKQSSMVAFKATPNQILKAVSESNVICNGKKNFLGSIGEFFNDLQEVMKKLPDSPKEFVYKLGQKNDIPESLGNTDVNGLTLLKLDDVLNTNPFKCSPTSTCACGTGKTRGEFAKDLFEKIGVEEPDVIKIVKD